MATFTVTNTNDSGAGSLRQAITSADASTGKNIINFCGLFDDGLAHTISLTGGGLSITDDITIRGKNPNLLTISEDSASRVFDITSSATATINGLTITNTYNGATGGGGISNEGILTLNNTIISDNTVNPEYGHGGGISNEGVLTLNNTIISDNSSFLGGGISNDGVLTLNNSIITGNSSYFGGGISNDDVLTLNNSIITGNSSYFGGGIYSETEPPTPGIPANPGAITPPIPDASLTVNNSNITGNTAYSAGGGISNSDSTLTVNNSNITGNTAYLGGGIYNASGYYLATVNYSNISYNSATFGGGIYNIEGGSRVPAPSTITVNYSAITDNTVNGSGGGIYVEGGIISFIGTFVNGSTISVKHSTITGNTVNGDGEGGGIANYYGNVLVSNSAINTNYTNGYGGGIYNSYSTLFNGYTDGTVTVSYSSISGNTAGTAGGGIYNSGILTVNYSSISDNTAGTAGGGIYNFYNTSGISYYIINEVAISDVTVSESTISGNQAHFGGGIYNDGTLTVSNSAIEYNKAFGIELSSGSYESGDGGGIYNNSTYGTTTVYSNAIACNFDTCQEYSNNRISPDDIAGNFINNGYNWIGINTATTAAGDAA